MNACHLAISIRLDGLKLAEGWNNWNNYKGVGQKFSQRGEPESHNAARRSKPGWRSSSTSRLADLDVLNGCSASTLDRDDGYEGAVARAHRSGADIGISG